MGRLADDFDGELPSFEQFYEEMRIYRNENPNQVRFWTNWQA